MASTCTLCLHFVFFFYSASKISIFFWAFRSAEKPKCAKNDEYKRKRKKYRKLNLEETNLENQNAKQFEKKNMIEKYVKWKNKPIFSLRLIIRHFLLCFFLNYFFLLYIFLRFFCLPFCISIFRILCRNHFIILSFYVLKLNAGNFYESSPKCLRWDWHGKSGHFSCSMALCLGFFFFVHWKSYNRKRADKKCSHK